jgi:hypothetical protein
VRVLHWARVALLLFIVTYIASLGAGALADYGSSVDAAFLAGIVSMVGIVAASLVAVVAQLILLVLRSRGKQVGNG